jgi:predicted nucleic acid-binding protein
MSYIDTSIIIAALDKLDSRQKLAQKVLEKGENKKVSELCFRRTSH